MVETPPNIPMGKGSISHSIRDELFSTGLNISRFLESSDSGSPPVIKITDVSEKIYLVFRFRIIEFLGTQEMHLVQ